MNCPLCQKPIKFQRFPFNSPALPFRLNKKQSWIDRKWHSNLRVECEETVIINNQRVPHYYKDYKGQWGCGVWIIIYPYRIQQHPIATYIQKWIPQERRWEDHYAIEHNNKISIEEAIKICWRYKNADAE